MAGQLHILKAVCAILVVASPVANAILNDFVSCANSEAAANTTCPADANCILPDSVLLTFGLTPGSICTSQELCGTLPQLNPVTVEIGATVNVVGDPSLSFATNDLLEVFLVSTTQEWSDCNTTRGVRVVSTGLGAPPVSIESVLSPGPNLLLLPAACRFGLRLNVTVLTSCRASAAGPVCSGRGPCVESGGSFNCNCPPGYTGQRCEEIAECETAVGGQTRCLNNGQCVDGNCSFSCSCPATYTGAICESLIDPCNNASNRCFNGGTCIVTVTGAVCTCALDFTGPMCETRQLTCRTLSYFADTTCPAGRSCPNTTASTVWGINNICQPDLCPDRPEQYPIVLRYGQNVVLDVFQNIATATLSQDLHLFEVSYEGYVRCNITGAIRQITPMPTQNFPVSVPFLADGVHYLVSVRDPNLPQQECERGWRQRVIVSGECQAPDNSLCGNYGACALTASQTQLECVCPAGINGAQCTGVDECYTGGSARCMNGATCVDGNCSFSCLCAGGFSGPYCSNEVRACDAVTCENGGVCEELPGNNARCMCQQGYTGPYCQDLINTCMSSPCAPNSTCINTPFGHVCRCPPDYTGATCAEIIDDCTGVVCANGGTSVDGIGICVCWCRIGYTDSRCRTPYVSCQAPEVLADTTCPAGYQCVTNQTITELAWSFTQLCPTCNPPQLNPLIMEAGTKLVFSADITAVVGIPSLIIPIQQVATEAEFLSCDISNILYSTPLAVNSNLTVPSNVVRPGSLYFINQDPALQQPQCARGLRAIVNVTSACYTPGPPGRQICAGRGPCVATGNPNAPYMCQCPSGYFGLRCQEIDECVNRPCRNGATCVDGNCSYTCVCPAGFTGINCETNITACPCENSGVCLLSASLDFLGCLCQPGYTGAMCESNVTACPCENRGVCLLSASLDFLGCLCRPGYTGAMCQERVTSLPPPPPPPSIIPPPPAPIFPVRRVLPPPPFPPPPPPIFDVCNVTSPCQNGGMCVGDGTLSGFQCVCPPPYFGDVCENLPVCARSNPCQNGGTCVNDANLSGFQCVCPQTHFGDICENITICASSNPCQNGGTCINDASLSGFQCDCLQAYYGDVCENVIQSPQFNGSSHLVLGGFLQDRNAFSIALLLRPRALDGLLFYTGQPASDNYIYAHLENGLVVVRVNHGFGEAVVRLTQHVYTQPLWKQLFVTVTFNIILVRFEDELPITAFVPGTSPVTQTTGQVYMGGLGNLTVPNSQLYARTGYRGCLANVTIDILPIDLLPLINAGVGISPCIGLPCQDMPCLNGATCAPNGPDQAQFNCSCLPGFVGPRCGNDFFPCLRRICMNNGVCFNNMINSVTINPFCRCELGWAGPSCENRIPTVVKEFFGDRFYGNSFAQLNFTALSVLNRFRFEFNVRPTGATETAVLFYSRLNTDVLAIYLESGVVTVAMDFGAGVAVASVSDMVLQANEWYYVRLTREALTFTVSVSNSPFENVTASASATTPAGASNLDLTDNDLLAGGFTPEVLNGAAPPAIIPTTSFAGCLTTVRLNQLTIQAASGQAVGACDIQNPCNRRPCADGSTCVEQQSAGMFTCVCPPSMTGPFCNVSNDACLSGPCSQGATCIPGMNDTFECECPLGLRGLTCSIPVAVAYPEFRITPLGIGSYLSLTVPPDALRNTFNNDITIHFRATEPTGVLLVQEDNTDPRGDYVSLSIVNWRVNFISHTGAGARINILSTNMVSPGDWTVVVVARRQLVASVQFNGVTTSGDTLGVQSQLNNLLARVYIGGHPTIMARPMRVGTALSLVGCVRFLFFDRTRYDLTAFGPDSTGNNVEPCVADLCDLSCLNNGTCVDPNNDGIFVCLCRPNFFGDRCQNFSVNPCLPTTAIDMRLVCNDQTQCCQNIVTRNATCVCPVTLTGRLCGTANPWSVPSFAGESYLAVTAPGDDLTRDQITINFTTTVSSSLLLHRLPGNTGDFLLLAISDTGFLEFIWELGAGLGIVTSSVRVDDGRWHVATLVRVSETTTLTLDRLPPVSGSSPPGLSGLNRNDDVLFLGGFDNSPNQCVPRGYTNVHNSGRSYSQGLIGCINRLFVNLDISLTPLQVLRGADITQCTVPR